MKLSDLIREANSLLDQHGDGEVRCHSTFGDLCECAGIQRAPVGYRDASQERAVETPRQYRIVPRQVIGRLKPGA